MCDIGADQGTDPRADPAKAAQRDKTRRAFHHPLDILQCFERLLGRALSVALSCHKSTLNNKVMTNFSSFKVFFKKNLEYQLHLNITPLVRRGRTGSLAKA